MSKEWKERPSNLLGLSDDSYISYCVDEAVFMFGRHVENAMHEAEEATKNAKQKGAARQRALTTILNSAPDKGEGAPSPDTKQFRDPASMFRK
jgi:hypothetical protein